MGRIHVPTLSVKRAKRPLAAVKPTRRLRAKVSPEQLLETGAGVHMRSSACRPSSSECAASKKRRTVSPNPARIEGAPKGSVSSVQF